MKFRISGPARGDLEHILATSRERWGEVGESRYASLLATALRAIAREPAGLTSRERPELAPGVRSMHLRSARRPRGVKDPVHVIFSRLDADTIEVVRVLHERMDPTQHVE